MTGSRPGVITKISGAHRIVLPAVLLKLGQRKTALSGTTPFYDRCNHQDYEPFRIAEKAARFANGPITALECKQYPLHPKQMLGRTVTFNSAFNGQVNAL
jgi:hypothetical protein